MTEIKLSTTPINRPARFALLTGLLVTLLGSILFSTKAIIVKKAFADIKVDPLTLLTVRMLFSLPFYLLAAFWVSSKKENVRLTPKQWVIVCTLGLFGYYISSFLDFVGLQYISAGLERLILFLYPTFAVLINVAVFKSAISRLQKWALFLTYAGIAIAYAGEMEIDTGNPNFYLGSILIFFCAITYSIYIAGSGKIIPSIGATKFTAYAMLASTAGIFTHFFIAGGSTDLIFRKEIVTYGLLIAIVATVVPSFLISFGLKNIGSNNVAIISSIGPVATILQAHYILGEEIFPAQVVGTALVIAGVLFIGWKRGTMQVKAEEHQTNPATVALNDNVKQ